jgi:hypothetical protein
VRSKLLLMSATAMLCAAFGGAGAPSATTASVHTSVTVAVVALPRDLATLDNHIEAQAHRAHASATAVQFARRASTLLYGDYVRVAKLQGEPVSRKPDFEQGFVGTNAQAVRLDTVIGDLLAHRCELAHRFARVRYSHGLGGIIRRDVYRPVNQARAKQGLRALPVPGCR